MRFSVLVFLLAASSAFGQKPSPKAEACLACHGAQGFSSTPLTPHLGGQPAFYVMAQLFLYREGRRENDVMVSQAKPLTDADLRTLSDLISKLPPPPAPAGKPDEAKYQRGAALIAQRHCTSCHGKAFEGGNNVPRVANQREDYTLKALKEYRSGKRIGYGNAQMPETVAGLDDAQLSDLAHFLAFLRP